MRQNSVEHAYSICELFLDTQCDTGAIIYIYLFFIVFSPRFIMCLKHDFSNIILINSYLWFK